jgi:hypothetical protein
MAGAMISISSMPMEPPSPACGLSPVTAMRGCATPARRSACAMIFTASPTPSTVMWLATSFSGMCEVTREVQSDPVRLNSQTKPVTAKRSCM